MGKKHKKHSEAKHVPTRHQISKWDRQKKIQRYIYIAGAAIIVVVLGIIGYGFFADFYPAQIAPQNQTVVTVNGVSFDTNYVYKMLKLYTKGAEPSQVTSAIDMIPGTIMQNELVIQKAPDLGIKVEDSEIQSELAKLGLPDDKVYFDSLKSETYLKRLVAYFDPSVPTTAKAAKVLAMVLPDEVQVEEANKALMAGEDFSKVANKLSVESTTQSKSGDLGWVISGFNDINLASLSSSMLEPIAFSQQPGTVGKASYDPSIPKKGGYWVIQVTEKDKDTSCHVRAILCGSLKDANEVKAKLKGGTDFVALAKEVSQHSDSQNYGGDLGWIQKGFGNEVINNVAFKLNINDISDPIWDKEQTTKGGFWIIKVVEYNPTMKVDADLRTKKASAMVYDWLEKQRAAAKIDVSLDDAKRKWLVNQVLKNK